MTRLLIALASLLVLALAAVLIVPSLVDWNDYRDAVARQLSAALGREVAITGTLDVALLPQPAVTVGAMAIGGEQDIASATVAAADLAVAFWPLLSGRIEIERVTLVDPTVTLDRPPGAMLAELGLPRSGAGDISLGQVTVDDGTLLWRDANGEMRRLDDIFVQLAADSLSGPATLVGSIGVGGVGVTIDARAGRLSRTGALPLSISIGVDGADGEVAFQGLVTADGGAQGNVSASGSDLAAMLRPLSLQPGFAALPFSLEAAVLAGPGRVELNGVTAMLADSRATGTVALEQGERPQLEATLTVNRLELDRWLGGLQPAALRPSVELPRALDIVAALTVDAIAWRGGQARQFALDGDLIDGTLTLRRLAAQLPGGTDLAASGTIGPASDVAVQLATGDLRRLLAWLGLEPAGVPTARLRQLSGAARLAGDAGSWTVGPFDLNLDGSQLTGSIGYAGGARPRLDIAVAGDALDIDSYLGPQPAPSLPAALERLGVGRAVAESDLAVEVSLGRLVLGATAIGDLALDATAIAGRLEVARASIGDLAGASLEAAGTVAPDGTLDFTVNLEGGDPDRLADALAAELPTALGRVGPFGVVAQLSGQAPAPAVNAEITALGGRALFAGSAGPGSIAGTLRLTLPEGGELLRLWHGEAATLGELDLYGEITGGADRLVVEGLRGRLGATTLAGDVMVALAAARPTFDATLSIDQVALDSAMVGALGRLPIDGSVALTANAMTLDRFRLEEVVAEAGLDHGALVIDGLSGRLFGGTLGLSGRWGADGGTVAANLVGAAMDQATAALIGTQPLTGTVDLGFEGHAAPGAAAWTERLEGGGVIAIADGRLAGIDLPAIAGLLHQGAEPIRFLVGLRHALTQGTTGFASLNAPFIVQDGAIEIEGLRLATADGLGLGRGTLRLADRWLELDTRFRLYEHRGAPEFGLILSGPAAAPQRRLDIGALQDYVAARP